MVQVPTVEELRVENKSVLIVIHELEEHRRGL
jgi:hypothetical protein